MTKQIFHIIIPLSTPAMAPLGIFTVINAWNAFLWPLIVLRANTMRTLVMAGSVLTVLPMLILYILFQPYFSKDCAWVMVSKLATRYIAAYDTEKPVDCLNACKKIRAVHEQFDFPGTFFIVGKRLEDEGAEYQAVLGNAPGFEIASHTYSHTILRDHPFCGQTPDFEARRRELWLGKERIEQTFQRPCPGLRPGCGFADALRGDPWLVNQVAAAGFGYISSLLWGPDTTVPALFEKPFAYTDEGQPDLWELPGQGWHENLLKAHNLTVQARRIVAWPSPFPEAVPLRPITTPEEEFAINKLFIDRAIDLGLPYVSLIWHPWSLDRFDPTMKMLQLTFAYVRELGMTATTYEAEWQRIKNTPPLV